MATVVVVAVAEAAEAAVVAVAEVAESASALEVAAVAVAQDVGWAGGTLRRRMWGRCRLLHIVGRLPLLLSD